MKFLEYDIEGLYNEVRVAAETEGVTDAEGWKDIVEDVLTTHAEFAEIEEDEMMELKEQLVARFTSLDTNQEEG